MRKRRRPPKPRRKRRAIMVPLASMGDIAFLLIIFFFVASEFIRQPPADVERATAEDIKRLEQQAAVIVSMDKDARLRMDREDVEDVELLEAAVAAIVQEAKSDQGKMVLLMMDRNLEREQFMPVWQAVINAGGRLMVVGELDE